MDDNNNNNPETPASDIPELEEAQAPVPLPPGFGIPFQGNPGAPQQYRFPIKQVLEFDAAVLAQMGYRYTGGVEITAFIGERIYTYDTDMALMHQNVDTGTLAFIYYNKNKRKIRVLIPLHSIVQVTGDIAPLNGTDERIKGRKH